MLVALNVFEGYQEETLGSVCVTFCDEADPSCTGEPSPDACSTGYADIEDELDLAKAVVTLIFVAATGGIDDINENLRIRTIPPHSNVVLKVIFGLGIDTVLDLLVTAGQQAAEDLLSGQAVEIEIPFSVRGNLWVHIPYLGRLSIPFGPHSDTWIID
jgi:hypothetical protein